MPLARWVGARGLSWAELTGPSAWGLQVALEELPARAFRETSVDGAVDTPFLAGTFVRLEFKLGQTSGQKEEWMKSQCKVQPKGRKQKCLAYITLGSRDKVPCWNSHCPIETQAQRESEEHQDTQCSRVERAVRIPQLLLPRTGRLLQGAAPNPAQH